MSQHHQSFSAGGQVPADLESTIAQIEKIQVMFVTTRFMLVLCNNLSLCVYLATRNALRP